MRTWQETGGADHYSLTTERLILTLDAFQMVKHEHQALGIINDPLLSSVSQDLPKPILWSWKHIPPAFQDGGFVP